MTRKLPKYVQAWVDGEGRPHHYFRRRGHPRVPLPAAPWSAQFMTAYAAAMEESPLPIGARRSKPGSVAAAVASYLDSTLHFGSLAKGTQNMRRSILNRFREQYGDYPVASMPQKFIAAVLTKKKPHAARQWLKTLRGLCAFAIEQQILREDPTRGIKLPSVKTAGHHSWTDAEIAQFEAAHPIGSKARLALGLLLYTAQRRGDVIAMGLQHIRNGAIVLRQQKTSKPMIIPIRPELQTILDATHLTNLTLLATKNGQPYRPGDFSGQFRKWSDDAGLPKRCRVHGLRKAACRRMAEAGYSANEIAAWSGHATLTEIRRYTDAADQERMARNAMVRENIAASKSVKVG
jgi:integrase